MPSNFFETILTSLRGASGNEDATEAELDQFAAELPTAESLAAAANEQAEAKFSATIAALTAQAMELQAHLSDPARTELMDDLTTRLTAAETELTEMTATVNSQKLQISALSKDLATAKVAYRPKTEIPDSSIPQAAIQEPGKAKHGDATVTYTATGTLIESPEWDKYAASKARKN